MLPHNLEAEKNVIGGLVVRGHDSIVDVLTPADFYSDINGEIFSAIKSLHFQNKEIDIVSVTDYLNKSSKGGIDPGYLVELMTWDGNISSAVRVVKENSNLRNLARAAHNIIDDIKHGVDVSEVLEKSVSAIQEVTDKARAEIAGEDLIHVADKQEEALNILKHVGGIVGVASGIKSLDTIVGGMDREELIIIGGQTGHGKSMLMQRIALNCAYEENPVLYLSLEMSVPQQIARFYTMSKTELKEPVATISKQPIYFYGGKETMSLRKLDGLIGTAIKKHGIKVCFIDHIHYFSQSADNVTNEMGLIVRTLKGYARKYQIPIVAISTLRKLNKKGKGKPEMDDLKDSVMIGYDADVIMMVYRDVEDDEKSDKLMVSVKKNRARGTIGTTTLNVTENYNLVEASGKGGMFPG